MRSWVITIITVLCALPATAAPAPAGMGGELAVHLLNRLGYGPAPGDVARVSEESIEDYLDRQLHPGPEPKALAQALDALPTHDLGTAALFSQYGPRARKAVQGDEAERMAYRDELRQVAEDAQDDHLLRALISPNQLQEVMTAFWFDHFNVFDGKGLQGRLWAGRYERDAIRPYVFGRFRALLGATAHHPAMLFYLDNWRSTVDGFTPGRGAQQGEKLGLNENYARELMELHTLGVDGGYTQHDVTELARIFTGWTFDPRAMLDDRSAGFAFAPRRHDPGDKRVLGQRFGDDGEAEGEHALDLLARAPATAHHLAYQLAQFFVADDPPPALVDRVAARFRATDGDLRETLRALLTSPEFLAARGSKFKTPQQFVISALRATAAPLPNLRPALAALRQLGQPIYGCPTPDGWKNTQAAWLNAGAMTQRVNFATALGSGRLPRVAAALASVDFRQPREPEAMARHAVAAADREAGPAPVPFDEAPLRATLGLALSNDSAAAIAAAPPGLRAALLLGSPEFMRR